MGKALKDGYSKLSDTYFEGFEGFFVSYAVKGQVYDNGTRQDMPSLYPMCNSPVIEPSPLNTRWKYDPIIFDKSGIL